MLYLVAVVLPPVAVLMAGKPFQALINILLTICLWIPGMIHALMVVHNHYADVRTGLLVKAMERTEEQRVKREREQEERQRKEKEKESQA